MSAVALSLTVFAGLALIATVLLRLGRVPFCTCGTIKLWYGVVNRSENSQHIADWYTPSHIIHGLVFYGVLHLLMPRYSFATRLLMAVAIEGAWEIVENTLFTIERYRTTMIALNYFGDSILNSISDIVAMIITITGDSDGGPGRRLRVVHGIYDTRQSHAQRADAPLPH